MIDDYNKILIKRIKKGFEDIELPSYQSSGASGMDIRAAIKNDVVIEPGECVSIPTNISISLPYGYECQVRGRSGLAFKHGIFSFFGTIYNDYRGEIGVLLRNDSNVPFKVERGMRIAQLVISKVVRDLEFVEVDELDSTERDSGGYGSTGLK